jgi:hypothetical protein
MSAGVKRTLRRYKAAAVFETIEFPLISRTENPEHPGLFDFNQTKVNALPNHLSTLRVRTKSKLLQGGIQERA